jgi:acyl-coenzyme A synthetase/AMP-(fatty) acid ligase
MASSLYNKKTLLNAFVSIAHSVDVERVAVECGQAQWTYGELDAVSSGLARDMYKAYGAKPTVAIVCENHPYTLAMLFATWKLGGIVAPLDHNVPKDIMERMLTNIGPTCVLVPSTERVTQSIIEGMSSHEHISSFVYSTYAL